MSYLNIEIKAYCRNADFVRKILFDLNADFRGLDEQTDTYFHTSRGRLKLREGNIENNLIYYEREELKGIKQSFFHLAAVSDPENLKQILQNAYGVKVVVVKKREIFYITNVKFHLDEITGLGSFVEIEASSLGSELTAAELRQQCEAYIQKFNIRAEDFIDRSYSDLILEKTTG